MNKNAFLILSILLIIGSISCASAQDLNDASDVVSISTGNSFSDIQTAVDQAEVGGG